MEYYRKNDVMKAIDKNNNYSLVSRTTPEPDGYVNHRWENSAGWTKIEEAEYNDTLSDWQTELRQYSLHVCVHDPRQDEGFDGVDDQGWLDIEWPTDVQEAMTDDSWFGFEENCQHGYCGRIDFITPISSDKMIKKIKGIAGIVNVQFDM